jgi:hypothetical protein
VGEICDPACNPLFDHPQGEPYRGLQSLGCEQAFGKVVHRTELQGPHGGQLIAFFRHGDHRREMRFLAQLPQQLEASRLWILRARPKRRSQHQHIAVSSRELFAPALEVGEVQRADDRFRTQDAQVMFQPLTIADILVNH